MTTPKPLLLFLHGVASTPLDFGDQVSALPDSLEGMAPWLRGLRPGTSRDTFDLAAAAADIAMTIELSGAPRATLFGVGEGALVALEIGLTRPDLPVDLVLVGPALAATAGAGMQRRLTSLVPRRVLARRGIDKARVLQGMDALAGVDVWDRVPELSARTLLIVGEDDRAGRAAAETVQRRARNADVAVEVIPGGGLAPHLRRAAETNAALYSFIGVTPRR